MLERSGDGQDMKIQAKDSQQGGLFQMEPEPGTMERDTLGPDFTYTSQPPGEESWVVRLDCTQHGLLPRTECAATP